MIPIQTITAGIVRTALWAAAGLPQGYEAANWRMTAEALKQIAPVQQVAPGDRLNYAEHQEEDPEVYVWITGQHERIEYYFFEGGLYKIFIVYDPILYHSRFYDRLIQSAEEEYGPPAGKFQDHVFGLPIDHVFWEDDVSILDFRRGAGFVYQVRTHKAAAEKKQQALKKKEGI